MVWFVEWGKINHYCVTHATCFLVQIFDLVCQMRTWNFHINFEVLTLAWGRSSKSSILCLYMKTTGAKQAKVNFAYFMQRDQHVIIPTLGRMQSSIFKGPHSPKMHCASRSTNLNFVWHETFKTSKICYHCLFSVQSDPAHIF